MRRIITGHDKNGKSIITLDGPPARSIGEMLVDYLSYGTLMEIKLFQVI